MEFAAVRGQNSVVRWLTSGMECEIEAGTGGKAVLDHCRFVAYMGQMDPGQTEVGATEEAGILAFAAAASTVVDTSLEY